MFKKAKKDAPKLVWWPVVIQEAKDNGRTVQHKVKVRYEILRKDEADELAKNDDTFLQRVVREWEGFADDAGTELDCTDENKYDFFQEQDVRAAVMGAYWLAAVGGARKN